MDAICLVCESAYEVEGELDLLVQIECPKCHRGVLMLDAEDESDITHYDSADSGIFDSSPPEPLDVAASVLLGGSQDKSPSAEDRWIAQAEDISLARETPSLTTIQTDAVPHDSHQTVDSSPIDAAAMALYNSEPEDLSRTLPEIPNPYAKPLPKPTPVPFKDMIGDDPEDELPKAPDTEVEMMPYGTGTAVDLPPIAMPGLPELSADPPQDPLADLEGMLDSAITSLPASSSSDNTPSIADELAARPVSTQEHASFDEAFGLPAESSADNPAQTEAAETSAEAAETSAEAAEASAEAAEASAASEDEERTQETPRPTLESASFHNEAPAKAEPSPLDQVEVSVTTHDHDDASEVSVESKPLEDVALPPLEEDGALEDEEDEEAPTTPSEEEAEVAINAQNLDDAPLEGILEEASTLVEGTNEALLPSKPESYDPSEPHELEPLNPEASSTIDADAFSFDGPGSSRKTRPLRPVQSVPGNMLPSTTPHDDDDDAEDADAAPAAQLAAPSEAQSSESSDEVPASSTSREAAQAAEKSESLADAAEASEPDAAPKTETALTPIATEPVREPPSSPSGEMIAPVPLTPAPESTPTRARSFSLAPPVEADNTAPPKELNRTLAFGFQLPEDDVETAPESAPEAAPDAPEDDELDLETPELATPSSIAAASGSFDIPKEPPRSSEALPMAGFGKIQDEPDQADPALAETQEASQVDPPSDNQDGMIDFDNLSADFFSSPANDKSRSFEQLSDLDDLIKRQQEDNKKILIRVGLALPVLIALVVLMFWSINRVGQKNKAQAKVTKRQAAPVPPAKKAPLRLAVRTKAPKVGTAPIVDGGALDAGAALDAGNPDAGNLTPDATSAPDLTAPQVRPPRPRPPRVLPPRRRIRRRPPPRRRIRRRPPPRRRVRRRPPPRRRVRRRPPPRRRRANRAAAKRYYNRGQKQLFANKISGAIRQYKRAIRADSRYAPAYRALGAAYMRKGNKPAAKRAWRTFLRLAPKDPMAKFIRKMIR